MYSRRTGQTESMKGSPEDTRSLWWKEFVEKISFEPGVKKSEGVIDGAVMNLMN